MHININVTRMQGHILAAVRMTLFTTLRGMLIILNIKAIVLLFICNDQKHDHDHRYHDQGITHASVVAISGGVGGHLQDNSRWCSRVAGLPAFST